MHKIWGLLILSWWSFALWASSVPEILPPPQQARYWPAMTVSAEHIKVTIPESLKCATLLRRFLTEASIDGSSTNPQLEIRFTCENPASRDEGYRIHYRPGLLNVIGNGPNGTFNGGMTLLQLIRCEGNQVTLIPAEIRDRPTWSTRFIGDYEPFSAAMLQTAARMKFGGMAFQFRTEWTLLTPEKYRRFFAPMKPYVDSGIMQFMLVYHIYCTGAKQERPFFNIASETDLADLIARCRFAAESGFGHIMICTDDWTPMQAGRYVLLHPEEKTRFHDSAGLAHGYLMQRLQQALPDVQWSFCPPVYSLSHLAGSPSMTEYLRDLGTALPTSIPIVWTGPKVVSSNITVADHNRFSALTGHHSLMIWDNSECAPAPVHRWETRLAPELAQLEKGIFLNAKAFHGGIWKTCYVMTANNYLWNPDVSQADFNQRLVCARMMPQYDFQAIRELQLRYDRLSKITPGQPFQPDLDQLKKQEKELAKCGLMDRWFKTYLDSLYTRLESPRPQLDCPLRSGAPVIDGNPDDSFWKNIPAQTLLTRNGKPVKNGRRTTLRAAFTREALYFALAMETDQPLLENRLFNPQNDIFRSSDLIELFLQPKNNGEFWQFVIDCQGNRVGIVPKLNWPKIVENEWQTAIRRTASGWTAEIKIDFRLLAKIGGQPPSNQTKWQMNCGREYNAGKELQCWSPVGNNSFLDAVMFGTLRFQE